MNWKPFTGNSNLVVKGSFDHFKKDFFINVYSDPTFYNYWSDSIDESFVRLAGNEIRIGGAVEYSTENLSFLKEKKSFTLVGLSHYRNYWDYRYYTPGTTVSDGDTSVVLTQNPVADYFQNFSDGLPTFEQERNTALYAQTEQHLLNDRLLLTLGMSMNYHPVYANFTGDSLANSAGEKIATKQLSLGNGLSPKAALVYLAGNTNKSNLVNGKLLFNSAFVPPAFLYRNGGVKAFIGAPDLESQSMWSYEATLFGDSRKWTEQGLEEASHWGYNANVFYNVVNDLITRSGSSEPYDNFPDVLRYFGFEAKAFGRLNPGEKSELKFETGLSRVTLLNEDVELTYFPGSIYTGGLQWIKRKKANSEESEGNHGGTFLLNLNFNWYTDILVNYNYTNEDGTTFSGSNVSYDEHPFTQTQAPIFNLNVHYRWEKLDLGLNMHNLFNTDYHLPSRISRLGIMRGEKSMVLLQANYRFSGR